MRSEDVGDTVAAAILAAVELGILPGGTGAQTSAISDLRTRVRAARCRPYTAARMAAATKNVSCTVSIQGCIKLKLDSYRERGGDSLSPQSPARYAGDKLSPPRLSELDAALVSIATGHSPFDALRELGFSWPITET